MDQAKQIIRLKGVSVHFPMRGVAACDMSNDDRFFQGKRGLHLRALSDITLDIRVGERVGISGSNGSGKTTLLKLISGIIPADQGDEQTSGKIRALISIGAGTVPAQSGRRNVELRHALLGLKDISVQDYVGDVEGFTELGTFFDLPIGSYSPGMLSRLQFAMSTVEAADVLVLDEWLGVADRAYQERAEERLQGLINRSKGLVIASHDENLLKRLTTRILTLSRGRIVDDCLTTPDSLSGRDQSCVAVA